MDYDAIKGNSHYAGMSPEEIEALMKKRFEEETGPGALSTVWGGGLVVSGGSTTTDPRPPKHSGAV